jgi:hypothetical protein
VSDDYQVNVPADDIIFAARYSPRKLWFYIIAFFTFPLVLMFVGVCLALAQKNYRGAVAGLTLGSVILLVFLEAIFFKELLFYRDRVMKVWHLFGQKTIPYTRANVKRPDWYMRWVSSAHHIFESEEDGRPIRMRLPLLYHSSFFPPKTATKIEMIMDYMTEDKENNPRKFRKSILPKEVVLQELSA